MENYVRIGAIEKARRVRELEQKSGKGWLKKALILLSSILGAIALFSVLFFYLGTIPLAVQVWEPLVKEELKKYDLEEYTSVVLAILAQESGGRNLDVMQSSESIELPPNTIKSPVRSIKTGVDYFQQSIELMEQTDVDLDTAIQSYNYGLGYIDYIKENGGKHTSELAEQFSKDWAEKMDWSSYGDIEYVYRVNQYRKNITK